MNPRSLKITILRSLLLLRQFFHEWSRVSRSFPSFIRQVTDSEINEWGLPFLESATTIAASFTPFLDIHSLSDDRFGRSRFRMSRWIAAKESVIACRSIKYEFFKWSPRMHTAKEKEFIRGGQE
jgi:hypothetical protein